MRFGVETDTYDREGTPVGTPHADPRPEPEALRAACGRFVGEFDQAPPPFSAKKVGGKKFYELARRGEAVPHLPKRVRVSRFDALEVAGDLASFHVDCSSGTYIRSLAHDVGRDLGLGAHLASLRRTKVGPFSLSDARTLSALDGLPPADRTSAPSWIPLSAIPLPFPAVTLLPGEAQKVKRGHAVPVRVPAEANGAPWIRLLCAGDLVALGHLEPLGRGALALARPKIVLQD